MNGYGIRDTSRLTGVEPVTLRAWERRYGLVHPQRTDRGHRLYGDAELRRINDIVYWVERGVAISRVSELLADASGQSGQTVAKRGNEAIDATLKALADANTRRLEKLLSGELALYPLEQCIEDYIQPVRRHLREASANPLSRAHLARFESVVQQKLGVRLLNLVPGRGKPGVRVVPLGRPARLDLILLGLITGQHQPVWCELEESDMEAVVATSLSSPTTALVFCLAPSMSSSGLSRFMGRRASQCICPVYVCCPAGQQYRQMPAGATWLPGGFEQLSRQLSELEGAGS